MTHSGHVFLVGFMGAGKTTVGRHLAALLGRSPIDLDGEIESATGRSIAELFAAAGEAAFRELETAALDRAIAAPPAVVATGGGTLVRARNRGAIRRAGKSVWLDVGFDTLAERVARDEVVRPLFSDRERARRLFEERAEIYRQADLAVTVAERESAERVATRIAELWLGGRFGAHR